MSHLAIRKDQFLNFLHEFNSSCRIQETEISLHLNEIILASVYSIIFVCGIVCNVWVLRVIAAVIRHRAVGYTNVCLYTVVLTCVDLLALIAIPVTVCDLIVGRWILPET